MRLEKASLVVYASLLAHHFWYGCTIRRESKRWATSYTPYALINFRGDMGYL
jgi:hypothetical protein